MSTQTVTAAPTAGPPKLSPPKTRAHALRSFDVADFPALSGREEEWRFTPLRRLRELAKAGAGSASVPPPAVGYGDLPAGVTVTSVPRDDSRIGAVLTPFDRVSALAYGSFDTATLVAIDKEAVVDEPVRLRVSGSDIAPAFAHTLLDVGALAQATVVLELAGTVTLADNVEVTVGD